MSGFIDLPREVRSMIYRYCLVSKYTIIHRCKGYEIRDGIKIRRELREFDLALLAVNRMVGEEAAAVFYGQNRFYASDHLNRLSARNYINIRHAKINYDNRDLSPLESVRIFEKYLEDHSLAHPTLPEMSVECHGERIRNLYKIWEPESLTLTEMSLKTLEIDVSNMYCPEGCCRLVEDYWEAESIWGGDMPCPVWFSTEERAYMQTRVTGIKDEDEAIYVHELGFGCRDCPLKGNVLDVQACPSIKDFMDENVTTAD